MDFLFQTDFRKGLFGTFVLGSPFNHDADSVMLEKYQSLSNQSFEHNLAHEQSLNLTHKLSFEPRSGAFIINVYYTKRKTL